jgi:hypothetical protein
MPFGLPTRGVSFEAADALPGPEFTRWGAVRAEEARKLADEVLEFWIVVRACLGHLDHM